MNMHRMTGLQCITLTSAVNEGPTVCEQYIRDHVTIHHQMALCKQRL